MNKILKLKYTALKNSFICIYNFIIFMYKLDLFLKKKNYIYGFFFLFSLPQMWVSLKQYTIIWVSKMYKFLKLSSLLLIIW